jgi:hypothetical protein
MSGGRVSPPRLFAGYSSSDNGTQMAGSAAIVFLGPIVSQL